MRLVKFGNRYYNMDLLIRAEVYPSRKFRAEDWEEETMTVPLAILQFACPIGGGAEGISDAMKFELKAEDAEAFAKWAELEANAAS